MLSFNFYGMIKKVEESYKGFNILKSGSRFDKFIFLSCVLLYIAASVFIFFGNVFSQNLVINLCSLLTFIIVFIIFIISNNKLQRRETVIYKNGLSIEENFYNQFIQKLDKNGINDSFYTQIIGYYNNKIKKDQFYSDKYTVNYFICFLIPVIISFCEKNEIIEYLLCFGIIGLIIIPGIWLLFSLIINRKQIMYNNIIYYLELALLMKDSDTSNKDK